MPLKRTPFDNVFTFNDEKAYPLTNLRIKSGMTSYPVSEVGIIKEDTEDSDVFEFVVGNLDDKRLIISCNLSDVTDLTIKWGDGSSSSVGDSIRYIYRNSVTGAIIAERDIFEHEYSGYTPGMEYTVCFSNYSGQLENVGSATKFLNSAGEIEYNYRTNGIGPYLLEIKSPLSVMGNAGLFCQGARNLRKVIGGMFKNNPHITSMNTAFAGCGFEEIPPDLFSGIESTVKDFDYTFSNSLLKNIPNGLFAGCTAVESFNSTFYYCRYLENVSETFEDCVSAESFRNTFIRSAVKKIAPNIFRNLKNVKVFYETFVFCENLELIPSGAFSGCSGLTSFYRTFAENTSLEHIDNSAFAGLDSLTNFYQVFMNDINLKNLPVLDCPNAVSFLFVFFNCKNIKTIPQGYFDNTSCSVADQCFYGCGITSLPGGLFKKPLTSCIACFSHCEDLEGAIPDDFFAYSPDITYGVGGIFLQTKIDSFPSDILKNFPNITDIGLFRGTNIKTIPDDMLKYVQNVKDFSSIFSGCYLLESIPESLFDYNEAKSLYSAFSNCTGLNGNVPALWNKFPNADSNYRRNYCFYGCNQVSNYDEIPDSWK